MQNVKEISSVLTETLIIACALYNFGIDFSHILTKMTRAVLFQQGVSCPYG